MSDKAYMVLFGVGALAVGVAAYFFRDTLKGAADATKAAVNETTEFVKGTAQSAGDLITAASTGNMPAKPSDPNGSDPAVNYLASVHDLVAHPVDSLGTLWNGLFNK